MRFVIGTVVIAWAAAACGDPGGMVEVGSETRDSAGIRIVENARPPGGSRLGWRVDSVPSVTIGDLEGEDPYLLHQVRDATRLSDGRIVVANRGSQELRVFDASGVHLATWGRRGEGPGEFSSLLAVAAWPGDSLIAWYSQQDRLSVFDLEGNFGRAFVPGDPGDPRNSVEEVSPEGAIVVSSRFTTGEAALQDGLVRRERHFEVVDAEGRPVTSLGVHPVAEMYTSVFGDQGSYQFNVTSIPFTRAIRTAVWGGRFVAAPNDNYEIKAHGREGTLTLIVRRDHALIQPTPAHRDAYIERRVAARPPEEQAERRRTLRERLADLPMAETFPAFDEIVADALGYLWVREYDLPGEERTKPLWTVFDPGGRILGFVETPPGLQIHEIGESHILGRASDSLGVEYVQVWPLDRARAGR